MVEMSTRPTIVPTTVMPMEVKKAVTTTGMPLRPLMFHT